MKNNFIWYKINENKEICDIVLNSIRIGQMIVDKDIIDNTKWMCYFEKFSYPQLFCFDYKMSEMHRLTSKEIAKHTIIKQFEKIISDLHIFSSKILKEYL